jgi:protease I
LQSKTLSGTAANPARSFRDEQAGHPGGSMTDIAHAKILIIATNGFEQSELEVPRDELRKAGAKVDIATLDGKQIRGWDKTDWGRMAEADMKIADAKAANYDAIVIPGGVINPDKLRIDEDAMRVVRDFLNSGKIVAAVCHGPWLLVQADALNGRQATSYKSIRKDVENAGAKWVDKDVVVDNGIITSRNPGDLEAFTAKIIEEVREGRHNSRQAAE